MYCSWNRVQNERGSETNWLQVLLQGRCKY
ncbi:hypothetical protein Aduo_000366 [Ancylostoma duodenale]